MFNKTLNFYIIIYSLTGYYINNLVERQLVYGWFSKHKDALIYGWFPKHKDDFLLMFKKVNHIIS